MKKSLFAILSAFALAATSSQAALFALSGPIDASQAGTNGGFGGGSSPGSGTISGTYDDVTNQLSYNVAWTGLVNGITNMHFHLGAPGVSGGVVQSIPSPWSSPEAATIAVSAANEPGLLAGNWYVNIHTSGFGSGEIRGQVNLSPVPEPSSSLLALGGLGLLFLRNRRS